jgi:hypothetical protein
VSSSEGLGFLIFFSIFVGIVWALIRGKKQSKQTDSTPKINEKLDPEIEREDREERELEREDSEGDGLMMGDPMFPEEFDDEDD